MGLNAEEIGGALLDVPAIERIAEIETAMVVVRRDLAEAIKSRDLRQTGPFGVSTPYDDHKDVSQFARQATALIARMERRAKENDRYATEAVEHLNDKSTELAEDNPYREFLRDLTPDPVGDQLNGPGVGIPFDYNRYALLGDTSTRFDPLGAEEPEVLAAGLAGIGEIVKGINNGCRHRRQHRARARYLQREPGRDQRLARPDGRDTDQPP